MKYQIYAGGTLFHIYIAILKSFKDKLNGDRSILIVSDHTDGVSAICESIRKLNYFESIYEIPFHTLGRKLKKENVFFKRTFLRNKTTLSYFDKKTNIDKIIAKYSNFEINIFYCQSLISAYFVLKYPHVKQRLLEDGERNYVSRISVAKQIKRKFFLRTFIGEGLDKSISEIHIQYPERLIPKNRKKGIKLDIRTLVADIPKEEIKKIVSIFLSSDINLSKDERPSLLVITQPLSEERLIPNEEYKISLYKRIIKEYKSDFKIFFKTHPRETTDYASKIEDIQVIPKLFPLELLNLIEDINFDLGITIYSSALNNLTCINKKIFLGMEYDKNINLNKRLI